MMNVKKLSGAGIVALVLAMALPGVAQAAYRNSGYSSGATSEDDSSGYSYSHSSAHSGLSADVTYNYLRGTQPNQDTDSAPRVSVGGMFSQYVGLDFQGLYSMRSKDFLVGSDLRLMATDWLYFKGGIGGYSDKTTHELNVTPLAGTGIRIKISQESYLLTEANYYQVNHQEFIGIGAGLGFLF